MKAVLPQAMHVGTVDVPWVENLAYPGAWFRLLQADLHLDAAGDVMGVSDAAAALRGYLESCEAAGVPRPAGIIR